MADARPDVLPARVLVVGLGETGLSCVRYLVGRGCTVTVVDSRPQPPMAQTLARDYPHVRAHLGGFANTVFEAAELLVVSPGVPVRDPAVAQAAARGIEVIGDVELFARVATAPVLAITGSNGKSTVTALVGAMCQAGGLDTAVGGNIGVPVLDLLRDPEPDVYVLELSSFQLETTFSLHPRAATVLNISADHMDRYENADEYAGAKVRIFAGDGVMVLNRDDPAVMALARAHRRQVRFGLSEPELDTDFGVRTCDGREWLARGPHLLMACDEVPLAGRHNLANALAAMALAAVVGVREDAMVRGLRDFRGLPHRTELVLERAGLRWIDDSKGTNVGATIAALNGMNAPVVLIAGGDGKGADFSPLKAAVAEHARAVVLIGRDAPLIEAALENAVPVIHAADMREAVQQAAGAAQPGDVVLLSPACASFDMFRNYHHRGEVFAAAVRELAP